MRLSRPARVLPIAVIAAGLVAVATGCTAVGPEAGSTSATAAPAITTTPAPTSGAASAQTKAAACQILGSSLQDLSTNLQSAYTKYASDTNAAVAALQKVSDQFQASIAKLQDPEALTLSNKAEADLQTLIADTKDAVSHPLTGVAKVEKLVPTIKSDFTKIGSYCS